MVMVAIAFLLFAVQIVAWVMLPSSAPEPVEAGMLMDSAEPVAA